MIFDYFANTVGLDDRAVVYQKSDFLEYTIIGSHNLDI
jgi:hypothetical protein